METYTFEVLEQDSRVDRYLSELMPDLSRSYIQKLIKERHVQVDEDVVKASYRLSEGEQVSIVVPDPIPLIIEAEDIPLDILYEDADLLVVNKPKGMVVHPAPGHSTGTLVNAILFHCRNELSGINGVLRPGIVHRIDKDTTGSLLVCKTDQAHQNLAQQLKEHSITRRYHTIVHGNIKEDQVTIDAAIGRHPTDRKKMSTASAKGRNAITHLSVLERFGDYTYVSCELETGRTHQIRVHLSSIGHPILGDEVYGPSKIPVIAKHTMGQTLHAKTLGFIHPSTAEYVEFDAPLPAYFVELLDKLRYNYTNKGTL